MSRGQTLTAATTRPASFLGGLVGTARGHEVGEAARVLDVVESHEEVAVDAPAVTPAVASDEAAHAGVVADEKHGVRRDGHGVNRELGKDEAARGARDGALVERVRGGVDLLARGHVEASGKTLPHLRECLTIHRRHTR